jgi:hypothetical protein
MQHRPREPVGYEFLLYQQLAALFHYDFYFGQQLEIVGGAEVVERVWTKVCPPKPV